MGIQTSSINNGPVAGFKNKVINGNCHVWQRGTSSGSLTNGTTGAYTCDRFFLQTNFLGAGEAVTVSRSTTVPTTQSFPYSIQLAKTGTSTGTACFLIQAVELPDTGVAGEFYNGSTWTVSCWADFDLTNTANGRFLVRFSASVSGGGTAGGVFYASAMVDTGITSNGFTKYTATFTINEAPPADNRVLRLIFQIDSTAAYTRRITGFQLEQGPVATEFEQRPIETELALCQRYANKWQLGPRDNRWWAERDAATTGFVGVCELSVPLRAWPTSATFGEAANWNVYKGGVYAVTARSIYTGATPPASLKNVNRVSIIFTSSALATALGGNWQVAPIRSNSNTLVPYVLFDAEL